MERVAPIHESDIGIQPATGDVAHVGSGRCALLVNIELRQLRYFIAVAEERHFRRAAERLYITQPAVSRQIALLEHEIGVRLFVRNRRRVELTLAGSMLLGSLREALVQLEQSLAAARWAGQQAHLAPKVEYEPSDVCTPHPVFDAIAAPTMST